MSEGTCPQCGSKSLYKAGLRYLRTGEPVQRWLCRDCSLRFTRSNNPDFAIKMENKPINWSSTYSSSSRVCDLLQESKNLTEKPQMETAQREGTAQLADKTGKIVEFLWNLSQNGVKGNTLGSYSAVLRKLAKNTDLTPESVKAYLAKDKEWTDATKGMTVIVYGSFLKFNNLSWKPPRYKPTDKVPFVPAEADIDQLISGSGRILATFLQFLKETGARSGEAARLKWSDVDFERRVATITPEKGSRARILPISRKLIDMLNNHQKNSDKIFATLYSLKSNFYKTRKSTAFKLQNPRLKEIGLHTFRHWKATTESTKQEIYCTSSNCSAIET
jgi:integrase